MENVATSTPEEVPTRHRLQLDFSSEAYERLLRLRDKTEARTNAEVVRNALRLYDWFIEQQKKNFKLQITDGKQIKEIELIF